MNDHDTAVPAPPSEEPSLCGQPWTSTALDLPPSYVPMPCHRLRGHDGLCEHQIEMVAFG